MKDKDYKNFYDTLRTLGYRKNDEYISHIIYNIKWILKNLTFTNVLDIGSSSGASLGLIENFFPHIKGVGIDISFIAAKMGIALDRKIVCGSACNLPFRDNSFDLIISSDVYEHIAPEDVASVINETIRICKKYIFIQVNTKKDIAPWKDIIGKPLHLTIKPHKWWQEKIEKTIGNDKESLLNNEKGIFCYKIEK